MKPVLHFLQGLVLCLGPMVFALACFDAFKALEPTREYTNAGGFLLLGFGWIAQWKSIWRLAARRPGRAWAGAVTFCLTMNVAGFVFFIWWPRDWAAWWVIISTVFVTFLVLDDVESPAAEAVPKGPADAGAPSKPRGKTAAAMAAAQPAAMPAVPRVALRSPPHSPSPPRRRWPLVAGVGVLLLVGFGGMAGFLFSGPGGARMREEARAYFGSAEAQLALGWRYRDGESKPQDYGKAAKWFGRAAGNGSARAHYDLGVLHHYGLLGAADAARARAEFEAAGKQDYAPALNLLGLIAQDDDGDTASAIGYWRRSAALGDAWGDHLLGSALLAQRAEDDGKIIEALVHLERARRKGVEPIKGMIEHIWATVDEADFDRVANAVFSELEGAGEPAATAGGAGA